MLKLTILPLFGGGMCPVVVEDGKDMLLIDCGLADSYAELTETAKVKGVDLSRLTKVIITHHDHDHVGGLPAFRAAHPDIEVISSAIEKDVLEKRRKSDRLVQVEKNLETAPEEEKPALRERIASMNAAPPIPVDIGAADGKVFDWCGGVESVASPGHMPGHIAVYIRELKTLVTGDAMNANGGMLQMANPAYTIDMDEAARSIEKFMKLDVMQIICYHGGVVSGDPQAAMGAVVAGYRNSRQ
jgi:glyoxylase-like metal-dependent hydrolase (beta-lactamase superfamily II)